MLYNGPEDESRQLADSWMVSGMLRADSLEPAQDVLDLAEEPSQFLPSDVPAAFKPESLAVIETQCRNFLRLVD